MDEKGLSRRRFFSRGAEKVVNAAMGGLESRAEQKARHWIRPPFAKPELDFLLACSRCSACIEACPKSVIFPLPVTRGAEVAATPALDLLNKGCELCEGWPCEAACEDGALLIPTLLAEGEGDDQELDVDKLDQDKPEQWPEKLSKVSIDTSLCLPYSGPECGACRGSCPVDGALRWDREKPMIDEDICLGCGMCREACIVEGKAITLVSL
ncbi:MAG: hypothetical protein ACSHWQ_06230 [Spongiibacteraceae bacterium]